MGSKTDPTEYSRTVELTDSFRRVVPADLLGRYEWMETRQAAAILQATNPQHFKDIVDVLRAFALYDADILVPGGNRSQVPIRLDSAFAEHGWHAVRVNTRYSLEGVRKVSPTARAFTERFITSSVENEGFEVDNFKGRVALDVEWNGKDGALDRDLSAYRALYEVGLIDAALIITRDHRGIRTLAGVDLESEDAFRRLGTSTTTNMEKLEPRLTRGDAGGCPVLAIGISRATWAGLGVAAPPPLPGPEESDGSPAIGPEGVSRLL